VAGLCRMCRTANPLFSQAARRVGRLPVGKLWRMLYLFLGEERRKRMILAATWSASPLPGVADDARVPIDGSRYWSRTAGLCYSKERRDLPEDRLAFKPGRWLNNTPLAERRY
jgi:hypothetical protein